VRRLLLVLSAAALAWGGLVLATGGIEWKVAGILFRSRAPDRALLIGLGLLAVQAIAFRDAFARDSARIAASVRPGLAALAVACAIALAAHAAYFGSFTAGGSDAFGYVSQAYSWASGSLPRAQPFPISVPWPSADVSLAPLGYRPGPQPHTMVPTYAPGLPLMMAASLVVGACGPYLVVPFCAALAVWLTFALGRRAGGPWVGTLAALFVATSPIVLFQSLWPMSDVPAAALWTGAAVAALRDQRRHAALCGLWTAAGLLVRPNLPIVPVVFFVHMLLSSRGRERWMRVALFSLPVAAAVGAIAALYTAWYGAPWKSGYGAAEEIFSLSNVLPNLTRYPVWLWKSQSPLILLAVLPLLPPFNRDGSRRAVRLCAALFLATLASYLVYAPFEEWWYLRFLLPAIPSLMVLLALGIVFAARRFSATWARIGVMAATILIVTMTARFSSAVAPPAPLREGERRYVDVGVYVNQALPRNGVVLGVQESGSVRHYGGRMTIRWDLIDRDWAPRAPAELERLGLHPYLVIEDFELPQFRGWFGVAADAPLPWPLIARMRENGGVSVYDLGSRASAVAPVSIEPGGTPRCAAPPPLLVQRP